MKISNDIEPVRGQRKVVEHCVAAVWSTLSLFIQQLTCKHDTSCNCLLSFRNVSPGTVGNNTRSMPHQDPRFLISVHSFLPLTWSRFTGISLHKKTFWSAVLCLELGISIYHTQTSLSAALQGRSSSGFIECGVTWFSCLPWDMSLFLKKTRSCDLNRKQMIDDWRLQFYLSTSVSGFGTFKQPSPL